MIKNEDSTLQNLGLSEGSPIFVALGRVLKDGECVTLVVPATVALATCTPY